jgi:flagellar protein FlgJ
MQIPAINPLVQPRGDAAARRTAQDFEAQALGALLAPMFEGLDTKGPFTGGSGEAQWRPMLVDAIARDIARGPGLGIADAVLREINRLREATQGAPTA